MTIVLKFEPEACRQVRSYFGHYTSNELLVETAISVLNHIGQCDNCRRLFKGSIKARERLRAVLDRGEPPPGLERRVRKSLRGGEPWHTVRGVLTRL